MFTLSQDCSPQRDNRRVAQRCLLIFVRFYVDYFCCDLLTQQHLAFFLGFKRWLWPTCALTREAEKLAFHARCIRWSAAFSDGVFLGSGLKGRLCIRNMHTFRPIEPSVHRDFSHAALCFSSNAPFKR